MQGFLAVNHQGLQHRSIMRGPQNHQVPVALLVDAYSSAVWTIKTVCYILFAASADTSFHHFAFIDNTSPIAIAMQS